MSSEHEQWTDLFGNVHNQCNCKLCLYSRKISGILHRRNVEEMEDAIQELMDAKYNIGEELDYKSAVLDGSWPSAIKQLERALEKAKNLPKREMSISN